eukprot:1367628-Amphidinium_carterae.2
MVVFALSSYLPLFLSLGSLVNVKPQAAFGEPQLSAGQAIGRCVIVNLHECSALLPQRRPVELPKYEDLSSTSRYMDWLAKPKLIGKPFSNFLRRRLGQMACPVIVVSQLSDVPLVR